MASINGALPSTITGFTEYQEALLFTTERVASVISLLGCTFVVFTFLWSSRFRKPVNRLILYATLGNVMMNVGTLISVNGLLAGFDAPLCQFQAFLVQMFLPADAFWNLSMAINTYLTVFKRYSPAQCKAMEKYYLVVNYGLFFFIAFVYCFVSNAAGRMYGNAVLWCWISHDFDAVRLVTCYVPAWCAILVSLLIYMSAGRELFKRRRQYANFGAAPGPLLPAIENPFASFKTTKVEITSELASHRPLDNSSTRSQMELQRVSHNRQYLSGNKGYEPYTVTIERGLMVPTRSAGAMNEDELELHNAVVASNRAAWAYTKCCVLFFVSLMITWIPSSLFRAYTLVHPMNSNFGIAYGAGFVLPLMGFWNTVIYVTISWDAVLDMFAGNIDGRVWKQWHGHWLGARKSQTEWKGCHGDSWVGRSRGLSLNSKEVWSQRIGEV